MADPFDYQRLTTSSNNNAEDQQLQGHDFGKALEEARNPSSSYLAMEAAKLSWSSSEDQVRTKDVALEAIALQPAEEADDESFRDKESPQPPVVNRVPDVVHDSPSGSTPSPTRGQGQARPGRPDASAKSNGLSLYDQIERDIFMSGEDDDDDRRRSSAMANEDALINASDFFLEHNENYEVTWREAAQQVSDLGAQQSGGAPEGDPRARVELGSDPSRPPVMGCNYQYVMWRVRRVIESFWFRLLTVTLIVVDLVVVVVDVATVRTSASSGGSSWALLGIDLAISSYFVAEIILRILVLGTGTFFVEWYNVVDFAVVLVSFITSAVVAVAESAADYEGGSGWAKKLSTVVVLRLVRLVRLFRICTEKKQMEISARQLISQNKRRYQQDGHDLDLTYVTKRVIATSFPSSGVWALYRNPIEKLAAFLNEKHPGRYRLYNLCSERTYDTSHFRKGSEVPRLRDQQPEASECSVVKRFMIDDHNVPSLQDMVAFTDDVKEWLSSHPDNVIVVHCKGGKGRTGTMICVWLVEAGLFTSAERSLDYFGNRRTDTNVSKKFQGVETPSQARYVGYFEVLKQKMGLELPGPAPLVIREVEIVGLKHVGKGSWEEYWMCVDQGRSNQVYSAHFGFQRNCQAKYDAIHDALHITLQNCPSLDGDVRVLFQTTDKSAPKGYENCPLYFWFNTALETEVQDEVVGGSLFKMALKRQDLDNPHKPKTWNHFRENFQVTVTLERLGSTRWTEIDMDSVS